MNGQAAQFSCKQTVALSIWDAKANRAKDKGTEAQEINQKIDKIKAKIIEFYGQIKEREGFVSAEMVRNAYQGATSTKLYYPLLTNTIPISVNGWVKIDHPIRL